MWLQQHDRKDCNKDYWELILVKCWAPQSLNLFTVDLPCLSVGLRSCIWMTESREVHLRGHVAPARLMPTMGGRLDHCVPMSQSPALPQGVPNGNSISNELWKSHEKAYRKKPCLEPMRSCPTLSHSTVQGGFLPSCHHELSGLAV